MLKIVRSKGVWRCMWYRGCREYRGCMGIGGVGGIGDVVDVWV